MNCRLILLIIVLIIPTITGAQSANLDSMVTAVNTTNNDTVKMVLSGKVATAYSEINPDSAYKYANLMLQIAERLGYPLEKVNAMGIIGYSLINVNNYPRSLQILLSAIRIAQDPQSERKVLPARFDVSDEFTDRASSPEMQRLLRVSKLYQYTGMLYSNSLYYDKALYYYREALPYSMTGNNLPNQNVIYTLLGRAHLNLKEYDSALIFLDNALKIAEKSNYTRYVGSALLNSGRAYLEKGDREKAKDYFIRALKESEEHQYFRGVVASNLALADLYTKSGHHDSSLYCIQSGLPIASYLNAPDLLLRTYTGLANYYKTTGNSDSIVKYQSLLIRIKDSLFNSKQTQQFQNIDFDEQLRLQQIETAKTAYRSKFRTYLLGGGVIIFLFVALILWRSARHRQIANIELSKQKEELQATLERLRSTQKQLIQSEKMASLGELTAGIAHEIQNPLNFVNNFSEVNRELIMDLQLAASKGDIEEVQSIAHDLENNENKIIVHGKRADTIVKGMLQHTHSGTGQKELTDINTLADEFLRLSFHGFRAKDKHFNVKLKTNYDLWLDKIEIVPQDFGRALLNIFNNAFYTVNEKSKNAPPDYEPTVSVSTHKLDGVVELRIGDNGMGIPDNIGEKVFQPFYTTKPAGQGTGLGLSLAYDIIKAAGGDISIESKVGHGTCFIVRLS